MTNPAPRLAAGLLLCLTSTMTAQVLPLLDPARVRLISQEISGDAAFKHVRYLSMLHRPRVSEKLWEAATYVETEARKAGLERIALIKQPFAQPPWNTHFADLWVAGDRPERIASTIQNDVHLAEHSRPTDLTAELIDIGSGTATDIGAREVRGKVVLTTGEIETVMRETVLGRGAAGIVVFPDPDAPPNGIVGAGLGRPDQVPWIQLSRGSVGGREPTFGFSLSLRQGLALRRRLKAEPGLKVHAIVEADSGQGARTTPWQVMVEGFIAGSDPAAGQDIMLTGHLQEEQHSANDDGSGVANLLEIGRALTKLIKEGRIPRPRRNIRFWWTTEIGSERQYFADHPEAPRSIWVAINQDMAGAEQSIDLGRKQDITRLPASRFHFFNDVAESVTEYLVAANTIYLAAIRNGTVFYPEPHLSHNGSQHRYSAEMVWYHEDSDHETFNEPPIGIPALSFTNMPDRFIHSSEDDLWNVDPTQLGRNAVSAALMAYIMATADSTSAPVLAAETVGRGEERIARNLRLALGWIAEPRASAQTFHQSLDQIAYAADRERRAIRSLAEIGTRVVDPAPLLAALDRREAEAATRIRDAWYRSTGTRTPPARPDSPTERQLRGMVPVIVGGPREFLAHRLEVKDIPGLNPIMRGEIFCLIDGKRSGWDIYRLVAAEAHEAGAVYYGLVTPGQVAEALGAIAATGLVRLVTAAVPAR